MADSREWLRLCCKLEEWTTVASNENNPFLNIRSPLYLAVHGKQQMLETRSVASLLSALERARHQPMLQGPSLPSQEGPGYNVDQQALREAELHPQKLYLASSTSNNAANPIHREHEHVICAT